MEHVITLGDVLWTGGFIVLVVVVIGGLLALLAAIGSGFSH